MSYLKIASNDKAGRAETTLTDFGHVDRISTRLPSWSFHRADWETYTLLCQKYLSTLPESDDIQETVDNFSNALINAANTAIPMSKKLGKRGRMVPWWNENCAKATRLKRAAFLKMLQSFRMDDIIHFKKQ